MHLSCNSGKLGAINIGIPDSLLKRTCHIVCDNIKLIIFRINIVHINEVRVLYRAQQYELMLAKIGLRNCH